MNDISSSSKFPIEDFSDIKRCLIELKNSYGELNSLITKMSLEDPVCYRIFKNKYIIVFVEDLLPWQKPLGEYFKKSILICASKRRKTSESEKTTDESLTEHSGNPLSIQFDSLHESRLYSFAKNLDIIHDLIALPEILARTILNMCSSIKNSIKLPYVVISQSNSPKIQGAIIYGNQVQDKCFRLRVENRGLITAIEKAPSIHNLRSYHLEGFLREAHIEENVTAIYHFLGQEKKDSTLVPVKGATLSVKCIWSECHAILEPVSSKSICTAKLRAVVGDDETGVFGKFKELQFLKSLLNSLDNDYMTWQNPDSSKYDLKQLRDIIDAERPYSVSSYGSNINVNQIEEAMSEERVLLYFPDKLWIFLRECSSFDDVIEAIKFTYEVCGENLTYPPIAHGEDTARIARDIRNLLDRPIVKCPELNCRKAAEFLIEIGVEKLRKDYEFIFIEFGLVSRDLFNHFVQPDLITEEAITCLEKLHSVLELTLICIKWLQLPINVLSEFTRSALIHYKTATKVDLQHTFSLHIPTIYARPLLNQMRPTAWQLSFVTSEGKYLKQSVHHFSTKLKHDNIYAPENYHPKLMIKGSSYTYQLGTLIEE